MAAPFHCAEVEPEQLALYIAICKQWPDSEDDFPHGKWAMIQYLEQRLAARIDSAIRAAWKAESLGEKGKLCVITT